MEGNENAVPVESKNDLPEKKSNNGIMIGIILALVIVLAVGIGLGIYNSPENRISRQLDLGQKYLEEQDYEQAIIAFNKAIEIDDKCPEAYAGLSETYIRMGEFDKAMEVAQKGYEITGDESLAEYIEMLESGNISRSDGNNRTIDIENNDKNDLNSSDVQSEIIIETTNIGEVQFDWSLDDWTINGIALSECDMSKVADSFGLDLSDPLGIDNWNGYEGVDVSFVTDADSGEISSIDVLSRGDVWYRMMYENPLPTYSEISFGSIGANGEMTSQMADFSYVTNVPYTVGDPEMALAVFKIDDIINNGELKQSYDDGQHKSYSFNSNLVSGYSGYLDVQTWEIGDGRQGASYWLDIFTSEYSYEVSFTISDESCSARYTCCKMGVTYSF